MRKDKKTNFFLVFIQAFLVCLAAVSLAVIVFCGWQFYARAYHEQTALQKTSGISLKETVGLNFSVPVLKTNYALQLKLDPATPAKFVFDATKRKLLITPQAFWQPGTDYAIVLPEGRTAMLTRIPAQKLSFSVADFPLVTEVSPAGGVKDVVLGAEDPITVNFNRSTADYQVSFTLDPDGELDVQSDPSKTQFKLLPKSPIKDGTAYTVKVFAKVDGNDPGDPRLLYAGSFETLRTAPIAWEKDLTLRVEQAKKYTKPQITTGKYIDINLETQIMTTFQDGQLLDSYLISSGKRGMDTPKGQMQIYNKARRAYSKAYGLYMPYWMAIEADGKRGLHELPEWPGGYKEGVNHLGIPVSHGCVRLGVGPAETVYNWAEIGTPVIIY